MNERFQIGQKFVTMGLDAMEEKKNQTVAKGKPANVAAKPTQAAKAVKPNVIAPNKGTKPAVKAARVTPSSPAARPAAVKPSLPPVSDPQVSATPDLVNSEIPEAVPEKPSEVQVLAPSKSDDQGGLVTQPLKPVSRWAFWKRASQRDEQLARISEGYVELVDMVRCIRDQADAQYQNNMILRESLVHLPGAIKGLEGFGKSHEHVGTALEKIHEQMLNYSAKDERMAESMDGFNDTLKGMDDTSKATIQTFDRVQERMRDSDIRMENLFTNVRSSEEKVSETMMRLQRNMSIIQAFFLFCLLGVIGGLIYVILNRGELRESFSQSDTPVGTQPAVVVPEVKAPPVVVVPDSVEEKKEVVPSDDERIVTPDSSTVKPSVEVEVPVEEPEALETPNYRDTPPDHLIPEYDLPEDMPPGGEAESGEEEIIPVFE